MSKYVRRCYWRWLPRRLHLSKHMGRWMPKRTAQVVSAPCKVKQADLDWLTTLPPPPEGHC